MDEYAGKEKQAVKTSDENQFMKLLHDKRTQCSQSALKYSPVFPPYVQSPGTPLYECQAFEDYKVSFPYFTEFSGLAYFYFLYTKSGEGLLTYRDTSEALVPGSIMFIDCTTPVRLEIHNNRQWDFTALYLNGPGLFNYYRSFINSGKYSCITSPLSKIPDLLSSIKNEILSPSENNFEFVINMYVTELITEAVVTMDSEAYITEGIPDYLKDTKKLLDESYSGYHSLDELAAFSHISKYQLSHDFTKYFGMPPIKYLNSVRMKTAKKLLTSTGMSVSEVGSSVGIENSTHFINQFKKTYGTTPKKFRRYDPWKK